MEIAVPILVASGVTKSFSLRGPTGDSLPVLNSISFVAARGEFVSLIGPSGCGKSTLLRMIAGLIPATSGEIVVDGRPVTGPGPERAMVFQSHNLLPWRTVVRNVEFGLEARGLGRNEIRRRSASMVEFVGLSAFAQAYPAQLSGGMAQRVGVARALVMEPALLLMDEPFGSLDAQTRMTLQTDLARLLAETAPAVLFVTHDIDEALYLGDRVLVMGPRPGTLIADVAVVFARPRSEDVRASPEFAALKGRVWDLLRDGMRPGACNDT